MDRQRIRRILLMISFVLFPITYYYFSPYLVIQGASEGVVAGSFIVFSFLFFFSLALGRGFCGWICPAGAEQELVCMKVRDRRFTSGWKDIVKFFIWVPWILVIALMFLSSGGIKEVDFLYQTWYGISISSIFSVILFIMIAGLIGLVALVFGRRGSCHMICWMSPFMIMGTYIKDRLKVPSLRLKADGDSCIHCHQCTENCPMSLDVEKMVAEGSMANRECILCGKCADTCPRDVISLGFGRP